jgi:hypothetical protein
MSLVAPALANMAIASARKQVAGTGICAFTRFANAAAAATGCTLATIGRYGL